MATVNLFYDAVFRDGAFTANDANVLAYALEKTKQAMDLGAELGAGIFVLWGGREGTETDACRRPDEAIKRLREAVNALCKHRSIGSMDLLALEAKPNEPRRHYMATGAYLGFIPTLDHPEMVRVNRGGARADGGPELPSRGGAGLEAAQVSHRPERSSGTLRLDFRFG
jgi:xylose isomerase